jgi:hypothetical protein
MDTYIDQIVELKAAVGPLIDRQKDAKVQLVCALVDSQQSSVSKHGYEFAVKECSTKPPLNYKTLSLFYEKYARDHKTDLDMPAFVEFIKQERANGSKAKPVALRITATK